jgi:hypothetical protein
MMVSIVGEELQQMVDEIKRLQTIVDALPKTRDGVPIVPGMKVYRARRTDKPAVHQVFMIKQHHWVDDSMIHFGPHSPIYSTIEAAGGALQSGGVDVQA